jgi:succinyl-CoA synthetase beta subunit
MNLHEYQAKSLFAEFGLPVPKGVTVADASEVDAAIQELNGDKWVVKAQVHAGGRGKAGGVKLVDSAAGAKAMVADMIGTNLVTYQTDSQGQPINTMLVEEVCNIDRELYLGAVIDRASQRIVVMASTEGGMEIEKVAHETPDKILKITISPISGVMPYQVRELAFGLGLDKDQAKVMGAMLVNLVKMFKNKDLSLLEINPLVITGEGEFLCLDGKVNIDSNALYRQKELAEIRDISQEDEREIRAGEWELNYISLDGNVGCMVNGAGLAMATMDLIKLHGGEPANFLDVGGGATAERVAVALEIILSDPNVKSVLVNIFGGIVRCDLIADGIIEAVSKTKIEVPLVARLEGNNAALGLEKLQNSEFDIIVADSLTLAAEKAIAAAKQE